MLRAKTSCALTAVTIILDWPLDLKGMELGAIYESGIGSF